MSWTPGTCMLVINYGRVPDWAAAEQMIETVEISGDLAAEYDGLPAVAKRAARQSLRDALAHLVAAWNDGEGGPTYEIRRVRDADLHILYDDFDDPAGLWNDESTLSDHVPGVFEAAGFDGEWVRS